MSENSTVSPCASGAPLVLVWALQVLGDGGREAAPQALALSLLGGDARDQRANPADEVGKINAAAQPSTTTDAAHAPPRMLASRWSTTPHTADVSATSMSGARRATDRPQHHQQYEELPSVKWATRPGDGDNGD